MISRLNFYFALLLRWLQIARFNHLIYNFVLLSSLSVFISLKTREIPGVLWIAFCHFAFFLVRLPDIYPKGVFLMYYGG